MRKRQSCIVVAEPRAEGASVFYAAVIHDASSGVEIPRWSVTLRIGESVRIGIAFSLEYLYTSGLELIPYINCYRPVIVRE